MLEHLKNKINELEKEIGESPVFPQKLFSQYSSFCSIAMRISALVGEGRTNLTNADLESAVKAVSQHAEYDMSQFPTDWLLLPDQYEPGWMKRQMQYTYEQTKKWPEWMQKEAGINGYSR